MLHLDPVGLVRGREEALGKLLEHLGKSWVKTQAPSEFLEAGVGWAVHAEAVEQDLHVGELIVVALFAHKVLRLFPEGS